MAVDSVVSEQQNVPRQCFGNAHEDGAVSYDNCFFLY